MTREWRYLRLPFDCPVIAIEFCRLVWIHVQSPWEGYRFSEVANSRKLSRPDMWLYTLSVLADGMIMPGGESCLLLLHAILRGTVVKTIW